MCIWGVGPLEDVGKMKSGSVELLQTCILSTSPGEEMLPKPSLKQQDP